MIMNFCLIDINEFDDWLNDVWEISFAKKFREKTTTTSKNFRKTKTKNRLTNDAKVSFRDEITTTISKNYRKISFRDEMTTTFDFENFDEKNAKIFLKIDAFLINRRSKIIMIRRMTFSYSLINFITSFNFEKFRQTSYSKSQFFQRIKYFDSRFLIWRLLIKRSISKNFIVAIFLSTNTKFELFVSWRQKKIFEKKKHDFNWTTLKIECIRQWNDKFKR